MVCIFAVEKRIDMVLEIFIALAIYILGVYIAFFQIQRWSDHEITVDDEHQMLFMLSMFSWLVFPIYGFIALTKKLEED